MLIREADIIDAEDLKELYFEHLTNWPPVEEQNMDQWRQLISEFKSDSNIHLLVVEVDGKVVSTVHVNIIKNLTHNLRPYAVIENVVTHCAFRQKGYASALLQKAIEISKQKNCYKVFLETGSNKQSTLDFYRNNGFEIDAKHSCLKRL